jgi:hypothetical protein
MTVEIFGGTHVPYDANPAREMWTFDAAIDGQHGIVQFHTLKTVGFAQASDLARQVLEANPDKLQGVTSVTGIHDTWRMQTPDGT